jgi:hypothetical protein
MSRSLLSSLHIVVFADKIQPQKVNVASSLWFSAIIAAWHLSVIIQDISFQFESITALLKDSRILTIQSLRVIIPKLYK